MVLNQWLIRLYFYIFSRLSWIKYSRNMDYVILS